MGGVIGKTGRGPAWGVVLGCSASVLMLAAGSALAQNTLGDGRGLERDMTRYGPGGPPPPGRDIMAEIRFRNAIVTGNAPGGMSFRGNVGYTDPFEFRGGIGSDDLFAFRRDSMYSGLAGVGIRGTEALQYQFALATGSRVPQGLVGDLSMRRDGFRRQAGDLPNITQRGPEAAPLQRMDQSVPGLGVDRLEAFDTRGRLLEMRSASAYTANSGLRQELLGVYPMGDSDRYGMIASPLRGIRPIPLGAVDPRTGLPIMDDGREAMDLRASEARREAARPADPMRLPGMPEIPGQPEIPGARDLDPMRGMPSGRVESGRQDLRAPTGRVGDPESMRTPHDRLMERLRGMVPEPSATDPASDALEPLEARLDALRAELRRFEDAMEGRSVRDRDGEGRGVRPWEGLEPPVMEDEEDDDEGREGADRDRFDGDTLRMIRESGGEERTLLPMGNVERDVYADHMAAAGRLMEAGRYFDAEARYITALAVRPEDPSAMVGRVHAQIGAGLLDSAAVNLRALLTRHPEMAGVRYAAAARPDEDRLQQVTRLLRERADGASGVRPGHATLLAYVGFQLGDRDTVREALELLDRADRERREAGERGDPMPSFLRRIWLDRDPGPARGLETPSPARD